MSQLLRKKEGVMELDEMIRLLQLLVNARGPCGQEEEVRLLCYDLLKDIVDEIWIDSSGNLVGKISGRSSSEQPIRLMAHMDEISMIVKRINEDGSLRVDPLGGILPSSLGQSPVEIMGDSEHFHGVLSFGSLHITKETVATHKMVPEEEKGLGKALLWEDVSVITGKSLDLLKKAGVHAGTRVVLARQCRQLLSFQDYIAGYFLDNRAAIVICLGALKKLRHNSQRPFQDVYFVATCTEEVGGYGASYAARTLPGDLTIAVDVGPVAKEYQTVLCPFPIVVYQDSFALYDKKVSDRLIELGNKMGIQTQCAIWSNYGSDASLAQQRGHAAKTALLCFPVENTHGYEIIHRESLMNCASLLAAYLLEPFQ